MGRFLIVSHVNYIEEHSLNAMQYNTGFEYNDFYSPDVLDNEAFRRYVFDRYKQIDVPDYCTMHGDFLDVLLFSSDREIQRISRMRMKQSMDVARVIHSKAVVFHTNVNPFLNSDEYLVKVINSTVEYVAELLREYPDINIYMENMFENAPYVLAAISEKLMVYPNYGVCFDYAHASISTTSMDVWVSELHSFIKHVHLSDNDLKSDLHLAIGEGLIDWMTFKSYYEKYFKECTILIENKLPKAQRISMEYLKKIKVMP